MLSHYIGFSWSQTIQTAFLTASCDFSDIFGGWWFLINTQLLHICFHLALQWKKLFKERNELSPEKDMQFSFWTTSYSDRKDPMFQTFVEELFKRRAIHILATQLESRAEYPLLKGYIHTIHKSHPQKNIMKKSSWENNGLIALVFFAIPAHSLRFRYGFFGDIPSPKTGSLPFEAIQTFETWYFNQCTPRFWRPFMFKEAILFMVPIYSQQKTNNLLHFGLGSSKLPLSFQSSQICPLIHFRKLSAKDGT